MYRNGCSRRWHLFKRPKLSYSNGMGADICVCFYNQYTLFICLLTGLLCFVFHMGDCLCGHNVAHHFKTWNNFTAKLRSTIQKSQAETISFSIVHCFWNLLQSKAQRKAACMQRIMPIAINCTQSIQTKMWMILNFAVVISIRIKSTTTTCWQIDLYILCWYFYRQSENNEHLNGLAHLTKCLCTLLVSCVMKFMCP